MARPRTVPYGPHPDQVYDVHPPGGRPLGRTVVYVHGGFWRPEFDRRHADPLVVALARAGYDAVSLEYRRPPERRWTAMREDLELALRAVEADPTLPQERVLIGHSAGGHLVAYAAATSQVPVVGAVSLAGVLDLRLAVSLDLGRGAVGLMMRGEDTDQLAAADPAQLPLGVPLVAVHGTLDDEVPIEVSASYVRAVGPPARQVTLDGLDHYDLIDPASPAFDTIVTELDQLFA